jgi:hypothetical protein
MEQPSSGQFGVLLGLPLIAIVLVVVIVQFLTGREKTDSAPAGAPAHQVDAPPPEPVRPVPPKQPPAAPPPASAPGAAPAAASPRPQVDAGAAGDRFQDPKIREHAQLMVTETARVALQKRDLEQLRRLRDATRQGGIEQVIAPGDLQAIDIGLDCLVRAGGFRARADDFLEDNPSSVLAEALRGACQ